MVAVPLEEIAEPKFVDQRRIASVLFGNRKIVVGTVVFLTLLFVALIGGSFVGPKERRTGAFPRKEAPSAAAYLGTTSLGQSVAVQWTQALPNSMKVGLIGATIGTVLGGIIG